MTLVDVLVSASVFAISSSASLQLWAAGSSWSQRAEQRREQQNQLDATLLMAEQELQQQAELLRAPSAPLSCHDAAQALLAQWSAPGQAQLQARGDGLQLSATASDGSQRQRWFHPAAFGLCSDQPITVAEGGGD